MSKAEKLIVDCTMNCSNLMQVPTLDDKGNIVPKAHPWLTTDDARVAVNIAREEMIEKACRGYCDDICEKGMAGMCFHKHDGQSQVKNTFKYNECNALQILIKAMKDE